ncbi:MAG: preprotein translocase subunit SecE [Candidatus Marinimicrobia bacterium]|jgi:preprotein translocase subunit SecE|nr:preprotein translocase subunit SecE [Candidatus Neomarinimicrobiota bacterium]MBT3760883.1 preprotein translocase subunit SecE [Candidatus Neomarinimicrobiota bacterium]MBT3895759.1 preprotein translocase subunit SecE [Candidatus Neomarinimicrobiota bacterium]MBT4538576.1 preprotein translocase subunit SecE [Candidatus Neomarinimicrobiota bacterium]MBT4853015.1 preprotein translocase subunit SecE [Candidatus Neomarinimicrobiota bacterium]
MIDKISKYYNSVWLEMKKVSWLTKDELVSSSLVVGVFSVIVAIFLFFVDFGLTELMSRLLGGK